MPVPSKTARQNRDGAEKRKTAAKTLRADILKHQKRIVSMNLKLDFLKLRTIFYVYQYKQAHKNKRSQVQRGYGPVSPSPILFPNPFFMYAYVYIKSGRCLRPGDFEPPHLHLQEGIETASLSLLTPYGGYIKSAYLAHFLRLEIQCPNISDTDRRHITCSHCTLFKYIILHTYVFCQTDMVLSSILCFCLRCKVRGATACFSSRLWTL